MLSRFFGRIGVRLLLVNLTVLIVPMLGLEFARLYERQLLASLERDMRNQSAIVRAVLERRVNAGSDLGAAQAEIEPVVEQSARSTRTRIRLLDQQGAVVSDSHRAGPPEGHEPDAPSVLLDFDLPRGDGPPWPGLPDRSEVKKALDGSLATTTRMRARAPAVVLFLAEPILVEGKVRGVVYVTRSTHPVLVELYKIRTGLFQVMAVAFALTAMVTYLLERNISGPLHRLAVAAARIARGELSVPVPVSGSGEVRELSEAFAHMKERLVARLRFASEFTADVVHELKTPLTSIRGAAELLAEGAHADHAARERFLGNIQKDVDRLNRITNRLLLLGRIEAADRPLAPVDVGEVARRVVEREVKAGHAVTLTTSGELQLSGRADDLEIAIGNLIENALRYGPEGSPVEVTVRARGLHAVEILVEDRGPGVSENNRSKIFERFFTTDAERGGSGLGLSIVRSVAEAHGGSASCAARAGGGSSFRVRLGHGSAPDDDG